MKLSDFIWTKQNALTPEFCAHVINKFENDKNTELGKTGSGYDPDVKQSTDLMLSAWDEWKEEDQVFFNSLTESFQEYLDCIPEQRDGGYREFKDHIEDSGYQIQRTDPGGFYVWHHDGMPRYEKNKEKLCVRVATFIWYLNDVKEDGYTEFVDGTKIQPETGKLLVFPAVWQYEHRGYPPKSEVKYIVTGWMYSDYSDCRRAIEDPDNGNV